MPDQRNACVVDHPRLSMLRPNRNWNAAEQLSFCLVDGSVTIDYKTDMSMLVSKLEDKRPQ